MTLAELPCRHVHRDPRRPQPALEPASFILQCAIADQLEEYLLQCAAVHEESLRQQRDDYLAENLVAVEQFRRQLDAVRFDACDIEQVVEERQQVSRSLLDDGELPLLIRVEQAGQVTQPAPVSAVRTRRSQACTVSM
ncbi:MAG: hypothetical protein AB7O21_10155 [Gammaproteobacteria bacterium]